MPRQIYFNKTDVLAADMLSGATSGTLTDGAYGTPTGNQWLVLDYDVPAKAEIIDAAIAGTALTGVTRGLSGGAAGTTDHLAGAKVASITVPQLIAGILDGSLFQAGTSSIGIPASATKQEAWTSWTPTWTSLTVGDGTLIAKYQRVGNRVAFRLSFVLGSTSAVATTPRFTLPVTAAAYGGSATVPTIGFADYEDNASAVWQGTLKLYSTTLAAFFLTQVSGSNLRNDGNVTSSAPFTFGPGDALYCEGFYEAA